LGILFAFASEIKLHACSEPVWLVPLDSGAGKPCAACLRGVMKSCYVVADDSRTLFSAILSEEEHLEAMWYQGTVGGSGGSSASSGCSLFCCRIQFEPHLIYRAH
jgi:hypothetical protein